MYSFGSIVLSDSDIFILFFKIFDLFEILRVGFAIISWFPFR
jgi:hypothetical protein